MRLIKSNSSERRRVKGKANEKRKMLYSPFLLRISPIVNTAGYLRQWWVGLLSEKPVRDKIIRKNDKTSNTRRKIVFSVTIFCIRPHSCISRLHTVPRWNIQTFLLSLGAVTLNNPCKHKKISGIGKGRGKLMDYFKLIRWIKKDAHLGSRAWDKKITLSSFRELKPQNLGLFVPVRYRESVNELKT